MANLEGKRIIVTGAGGGIGQATVSVLARSGADVVATDLPGERLDKAALTPGKVSVFELDVTEDAAWEAVMERLGREPIHGLVNNAGIEGAFAPISEYPTEMARRVFEVNVVGVFLGMKIVGPYLADGASIVNVASVAGIRGAANVSVYAASKHAVIGLTRSAAKELADRQIRCNAVGPSPIETRMMRALEDGLKSDDMTAEEMKAQIAGNIPFGRYGHPAEVAELIEFLISDKSRFLSGAIIPIDGALTA